MSVDIWGRAAQTVPTESYASDPAWSGLRTYIAPYWHHAEIPPPVGGIFLLGWEPGWEKGLFTQARAVWITANFSFPAGRFQSFMGSQAYEK